MAFQDWTPSGSRNDSLCILPLLSGSDAGGGTVGIGKTAVSSPPPFTQTRGAMLAFYHLHRDLVLAWA